MIERCGLWMPRAKAPCALRAGHPGHCARLRTDSRARMAAYYKANREHIRANQAAYYEANSGHIRGRVKSYYESERGRAQKARYVEMGYAAAASARHHRREADERRGDIDPRLETLLGGLIAPSKP